jgi:hypothetical protein
MDEPFFPVESTFRIRGLGLALVGITAEQYNSIKAGDKLAIHQPDGSVIQCRVKAVEYPPGAKWVGERPACPRYPVVVDAENVPVGSAVHLCKT